MVDDAFEGIETFEVGNVAFSGEAGSDDEVFGFCCAAIGCLDGPFPFGLVELGVDYNAFKGTVLLDFKHFVDMVEIVSQLLVVGVIGGPRPVFEDFRDRILIPTWEVLR